MASDKQIQDVVNKFPNIQRIVNKLNGDNGIDGKAVIISNFSLLRNIPSKPKSTYAAESSPTKAEFDLLVDDVHSVYNMLVAIANQLK